MLSSGQCVLWLLFFVLSAAVAPVRSQGARSQAAYSSMRGLAWPPKRARENVNYLFPPPNYSFTSTDEEEPSCDELRAIWRLSKRAAQQSLLTNEIPTHHPGMFGYVVKSPAVINSPSSSSTSSSSRGRPRQSFGKIVVDANSPRPPPVTPMGSGFDEVAHELRAGTFAEKPFRHLGIGQVIKPDNKRPLTYGNYVRPPPQTPNSYNPKVAPTYGFSSRLEPPARPGGGFHTPKPVLKQQLPQSTTWGMPFQETVPIRPTLRANPPSFGNFETYPTGFSTDTTGCQDIATKYCRRNDDCSCYGLYSCVNGRCRSKSAPGKAFGRGGWESNSGQWHGNAFRPSELGLSARRNKESVRRNKHRSRTERKKLLLLEDFDFPDNPSNNNQFGSWS